MIIPLDIAKIANELGRKNDLDFHPRMVIASAILAERQRCAGIAQRWANDNHIAPEPRLIAAYINRSISHGETA